MTSLWKIIKNVILRISSNDSAVDKQPVVCHKYFSACFVFLMLPVFLQQVVDDMGDVKFSLDTDAASNSWLKYVRCAPSFEEQNLAACHLTGDQVSDVTEVSWWGLMKKRFKGIVLLRGEASVVPFIQQAKMTFYFLNVSFHTGRHEVIKLTFGRFLSRLTGQWFKDSLYTQYKGSSIKALVC